MLRYGVVSNRRVRCSCCRRVSDGGIGAACTAVSRRRGHRSVFKGFVCLKKSKRVFEVADVTFETKFYPNEPAVPVAIYRAKGSKLFTSFVASRVFNKY